MDIRTEAWKIARQRTDHPIPQGLRNRPAYGAHVFGPQVMKNYLSATTFNAVMDAMQSGNRISMSVADQVANAMKNWAQQMGASHFSHWFQPLSGVTAEKQESFFRLEDSMPVESFQGSALIQQEPDASSFPTGGLRSTFEARGITAWDPSSPAFLMDIKGVKTLCIPTIFVSYTGKSLDFKAPLLKSRHYLDIHGTAVAGYFDRFASKVFCQLGCEQEFYLIDEAFSFARQDLQLLNRTLFGLPASHLRRRFNYFGSIPERVYHYLLDLEDECHKVGIPVRMRHNEEGPSQLEIVPNHEESNIAIDHNLLLMDLMNRVAARHHFKVILNEKPFEEFSGSGKHCNWSLHSDTGHNLLAPADTPRKNLNFLTFFINSLKAFSDNGPLLRASVASWSNDLRLGQAGAPPASVSVFIGKNLSELLEDIQKRGEEWFLNEEKKAELKLNIHQKIPEILLDHTDRNRISPIAFTGKKFEFRQLGASQHPGSLMTVVNTVVGHQLKSFKESVDSHMKTDKLKKDAAILRELQVLIKDVEPILFEGDNYSDAWKSEMKKHHRLLPERTPEAIEAFLKPEAVKLFEQAEVYQQEELKARKENQLNIYFEEARQTTTVLMDICQTQILPAVSDFERRQIENLLTLEKGGQDSSHSRNAVNIYSNLVRNLNLQLEKMRAMIEKSDQDMDVEVLIKTQGLIRTTINKLEALTADDFWPVSKIREILFLN